MQFTRKLAALSVSVGAVALALSGPAHASVATPAATAPAGYEYLYGFGTGQCMTAATVGNGVQVDHCQDAATEQWSEIPVQEAGHPFTLFSDRATNTCLATNGRPTERTAVIHKPCSTADASEYWLKRYVSGSGDHALYRLVSLVNSMCIDRPEASTGNGTKLQMWDCYNGSDDWNPLHDPHYEQTVYLRQSV
jgi:hypothetical protein